MLLLPRVFAIRDGSSRAALSLSGFDRTLERLEEIAPEETRGNGSRRELNELAQFATVLDPRATL
jgi:hypothetical protein